MEKRVEAAYIVRYCFGTGDEFIDGIFSSPSEASDRACSRWLNFSEHQRRVGYSYVDVIRSDEEDIPEGAFTLSDLDSLAWVEKCLEYHKPVILEIVCSYYF